MDSLQSYETAHGDALRPIPTEIDRSFNGDHVLMRAVTVAEFRQFTSFIQTMFKEVKDTITEERSRTAVGLNLPASRASEEQDEAQASLIAASLRLQSLTFGPAPDVLAERERPLEDHINNQHPDAGHIAETATTSRSRGSGHPKAGLLIRNLPRGANAWQEAVKQWEQDDPVSGLVALRHWPVEWYTKENKAAFGIKRGYRKIVAEEFER